MILSTKSWPPETETSEKIQEEEYKYNIDRKDYKSQVNRFENACMVDVYLVLV